MESISAANVIEFRGVSKRYGLGTKPLKNLWQALRGINPICEQTAEVHHALHPIDLSVYQGEVIGIVGLNGAGKSTLLQLISGTLTPSAGEISVAGRIGAILELGAGFDQEFTGRENTRLALVVSQTPPAQIDFLIEKAIAFADLGSFIDSPVKTYSSGMLMRLAFAVATCHTPDILVIDEALSVGDGAFARKSFDRIMQLKSQNKTILFCSHSLFQIEALCGRVIWLHQGRLVEIGSAKKVLSAYDTFLNSGVLPTKPAQTNPIGSPQQTVAKLQIDPTTRPPEGSARFTEAVVSTESGAQKTPVKLRSGASDLRIKFSFLSDPKLPPPTVGITLKAQDGRIISSTATFMDQITLKRQPDGRGGVELDLPLIPLLKGRYAIDAYLMCEKGVFIYDAVAQLAELEVEQSGIEQGLFSIPHAWRSL